MKNPGVYKALDINGKPVVIKVGQSVNIAVDGMEFAFDKMYTPEYYGFYWSDDNCGIAITKGLYCATPSVLSNIDAPRMLPAPKGMVMRIGQVNSSITMRDGELWLKSKDGECQMPKVFDLFGGDLAFYGANANGVCKDATPLSPAVLNLRGGRVLVDMHGDYCYSTMLFANTNAFRVVVHDKPAVFKAVNHTAAVGPDRTIDIARPIESGVEEGKDGGLTLEGAPVFKFRYPVLLNGPFTALDGEILLDNRADTDTTAAFFGSGDVNFGNVEFRFPDNPASSKTVKFATDESASFCVKGASQFTFKKNLSALPQNVEIGGDLVRTRGGVLFLSEHGCAGGFQSTFKVDKGVELNEALLTKMPILFRDPSVLKHRFATCAEDGRIVPLTDVATSLGDADGKKAVVLSSAAKLSAGEEKSIAALMIDDVKLELDAGSKINVGVGDDPAFVVWNKTYISGKLPKGSGTVDFGAREGVVVIDSRSADCATFPLPFTLAGSGGVTFISAPEKAYKYLKLTGTNTYSGPTTINSIRVEPCTYSAFGLGEVHVGGGERAGGRIYFGTPVTLPNDFFVSGRGINKSVYSDTSGAFVFATNAALTGSVTLEGETRMTLIDGARGTISGTVKGVGRLSLYPGDGTLVLEGDNTYTGGTEVVGASLAVTRTGSLGSGDVVLDGGTLVFENASAMSLTNTVSGIGTIALKGSAPVAFDGNLSNLEASLDLCGTWQTFTEMPPFSKIVNSHSGKATFALASNLGTVSWPGYAFEGKVSLAIGEGTVLDLGGREIEVFRLEPGAASKIVNGTVKQIKPMVGMRVIFR
jgi:autotransporter-associated beta strand protein